MIDSFFCFYNCIFIAGEVLLVLQNVYSLILPALYVGHTAIVNFVYKFM